MPIRPHANLEGPQLAGWEPRERPPASHRLRQDANVVVPMPDGVRLRADVYRPQEPGRYPALVSWSAYPRYIQTSGAPVFNNEAGVVGFTVARGYAHVLVSARGVAGSGGMYDPWFSPQEQRDLADAIAWVADQPWCDGNVGMIDISYFAMSQLLAAARRPPALKAIFPYDFSTDLHRHAVYHGGLPNSDFDGLYVGVNGDRNTLGRTVPPSLPNAVSHLLDRERVGKAFDRIFPRIMRRLVRGSKPREEFVRAYARIVGDEPYGGDWYDERSAWPVLEQIEVPTGLGVTQGAVGLHQFGPYDAWHRMTAPRKLFVGPPDAARPWKTFHEEILAFYDHHLKGADNGWDELPPVRYWLQGADTWRGTEDWPPPDAQKVRFFPAPQNGDARETQPLIRETPAGDAELSFLALPRSTLYPEEVDRYDAQVLGFATEPFAEATEVVGPITLSLRLSSTAIDTYLTARLSDLDPDGKRRSLSFGYQRAAIRRVDEARSTPTEIVHQRDVVEPLTPGEPVTLVFSMTVSANLFRKEHRLLLEIGSRTDLIGATFAEGFVYFDLDAPPYPARNRLHAGEDSYLEVSVRPRSGS
jgi:predicted acyl esterase